MSFRIFYPGKGPARPQSFRPARRAVTARGVYNGALVAPARQDSVGQTQGAYSSPGYVLTFPTLDGLGANWWIDVTVSDQDPATTPPDPLDAAASAAEQTAVAVLMIDWDRSGYAHPRADLSDTLTTLTIEIAITGDLPEEAGLVEGYASAQLTATLGVEFADGLHPADLLAPYRTDSELYLQTLPGAPVRCELGLITAQGPELRRQLTGQVRNILVDAGTRTVELTVADLADTLREPITLPVLAQSLTDVLANHHKFLIAPQAIIDFVLRRNNIYASPRPHPQAQISATGHGWLGAEIGRNAIPRGAAPIIADDDWWVPGPFDMLAVRGVWDDNAAYQEFFAEGAYNPIAGNGIGIGVWVNVGNDMGVTAGYRAMFQLFPLVNNAAYVIELGIWQNGALGGYINNTGFAQSINTPTHWQYVGLHFQHMNNGNTRIRYRQNGVTTFGDITTPALTSTVAPYLQCTAWLRGRSWSNYHVWYDANPPAGEWPGETHTPKARIDTGINRLTHLPDRVNADSWQLIKEVATAEYGLCGFDEYGEFYFKSRTAAYDPTIVQREITSDGALLDLATQQNLDTVRNIVTTETQAGYVTFQHSIIDSRDPTEYQSPSGVSVYEVALPYSAVGTTTQQIPQIPSASWGDQYLWGFVAVRADSPATEIPTPSGITVLFTMIGDRRGKITVWNYSPYPVRFATTGGQPALRVQGWQLDLQPAVLREVRYAGSVATYGPRVLPIPASDLRQLPDPLATVAGGLAARLANPLTLVDEVPCNGHPGTRAADTVRLVDPDTTGSLRATVTKLTRTYAESALQDTLAVRPVAPPGLGITDDPELGLADSTLIAGP